MWDYVIARYGWVSGVFEVLTENSGFGAIAQLIPFAATYCDYIHAYDPYQHLCTMSELFQPAR
jgi:hypothetical protein